MHGDQAGGGGGGFVLLFGGAAAVRISEPPRPFVEEGTGAKSLLEAGRQRREPIPGGLRRAHAGAAEFSDSEDSGSAYSDDAARPSVPKWPTASAGQGSKPVLGKGVVASRLGSRTEDRGKTLGHPA